MNTRINQDEDLQKLEKKEQDLIKKIEKKKHELSLLEGELFFTTSLIWLKKHPNKTPKDILGAISHEDIPKKYDINMFQDKKVIYALSVLKEATVKELAEYMQQQEKGSDYKAIYHRVQQVTIRLQKENKIIGIGDYARKFKLNMK